MADSNRLIEQEGVKYFGYRMAQLGALVRETAEHDKGIDAELEIIGGASVKNENVFIGVQIKSRTQAKKLSNGYFAISVTEQNLSYWHKYDRPVIIVLYNKLTSDLYWVRVDDSIDKEIHISIKSIIDETAVKLFIKYCQEKYLKKTLQLDITDINPILSSLVKTYGDLSAPLIKRLNKFFEFYQTDQFEKAREEIKPLAEVYNTSKDILSYYALVLMRVNDKTCETYADKLLTFEGLGEFDYLVAALCFATVDKHDKAILLYEQTFNAPKSSLALYHYAVFASLNNNNIKAKSLLDNLVTLDNLDDKLAFNCAVISTYVSEYNHAIQFYDKVLAINNKLGDAYNNKALILIFLGKHDKAFSTFEKGISLCNNNFPLFYNYASLLKDYGENDKSLEYLQRALKLVNCGKVWRDIALLYCRLNKISQAEKIFTEYFNEIFGLNKDESIKYETAFADMGFEVTYLIYLQIDNKSVSIKKVYNGSERSFFNVLRLMCKANNISFENQKEIFLKELDLKGFLPHFYDKY
jgi:tetratricopeptide (TPR) repeat protein